MTLIILTCLLTGIFSLNGLNAQEVQIPVCQGIQVITKDMGKGVPEFDKYTDFQQATLYKDIENKLILEILYKQDGQIVRSRVPMSREEADKLCQQMIAKTGPMAEEAFDPDRDGKRKIIGATMAYSLLYYAYAIPTAFDWTEGEAYAGSYLLIGAAGYFVPMLATRNATITSGMAKGYTYGCFLGIFHGLSLGSLLTNGSGDNAILGVSVAASIGEGIGGLYYAKNHQLNRAYMRMMGSMGTWGLLYGMAIPAMAESEDNTIYAASSLAISAAGVFAGDQLAKKFKPADGDVTVMNGLGIIGTALPIPLLYSILGDEGTPATYIGSMILGSGAGLYAGLRKTKNWDYTRSDGNIILLGEIAGGLIGSGISLIAGGNETTFMWLTAAGLVGGFVASDFVIRNPKKDKKTTGSSFSFDFNPIALQKLIKNEPFSFDPGKRFQNPDLLKLGLKF
jgi:hypothetical protein